MNKKKLIINNFIQATIFIVFLIVADIIYIKYSLKLPFTTYHIKTLIVIIILTYMFAIIITVAKIIAYNIKERNKK